MRPVDVLTFGFLTFLFITTAIFSGQIPNAHLILSLYASLATALFLLIYSRKKLKSKTMDIIYALIFPIIALVLIFDSLGGLIHYINPVNYDDLLINIDYMIFKVHPTIALERFISPVLTEILQFAYTSYYFLPVILGAVLKIKGKEAEFDRTIFLILLCFFLSYVGYFFVPAVGPRYTMNHLQGMELHGIFLRDKIDGILNSLEGIKSDAFPSGHTAVTLVVLYAAYKFQKNLFWFFLPVVMALLVSTVYLRYHYVIDVIAGILLFVFTIYAGEKFYNWWERNNKLNQPEADYS